MTALLQLRDLQLGYGSRQILAGVNLELQPGRWVALVGPNAAGKTTLLRSLAGLLKPAVGEVWFEGEPLYPVQGRRGPLPAFAAAPDQLPPFLTVAQSLSIYAEAQGLSGVPADSTALAAALGLAAHQQQLIRNVSLGTRQKLAIVLALMTNPSLLLLDEAFNGLDFHSGLVLKQLLRERLLAGRMSILLATHALDVVSSCCDGLVLLDSGRVAQVWDERQLRDHGDARQLEQALAAALPGVQSR